MKKLLSFILLSTALNVGVAASDAGHGTGFWIWEEVIVNCPGSAGSPFDSEYKRPSDGVMNWCVGTTDYYKPVKGESK